MTRLKTIDPIEAATGNSVVPKGKKGEQLPSVSVGTNLLTQLRKFRLFTDRKKKDEALASTARADILLWAKQEFVKRIAQGQFGNFLITDGGTKNNVQFVVQARGKDFADADKKTLTESYGDTAANLLAPRDEVFLNLEVWNLHRTKIIEALNAKNADGQPLIEESILKSLFYRTMKIKDSVIEDAVKLARDEEGVVNEKKLAHLLFEDLKLVCSLSAK